MNDIISYIIFFCFIALHITLFTIIVVYTKKKQAKRVMSDIDLSNYQSIEIRYTQSLTQSKYWSFKARMYINNQYLIIDHHKKSFRSYIFNYSLPLIIINKNTLETNENTGVYYNQPYRIKIWKNSHITMQMIRMQFSHKLRYTISIYLVDPDDIKYLKEKDIEHWC